MASAFENIFGGVVVFGGIAGGILWIGTAIFAEDEFINPQKIEIPSAPAQVVSAEDVGKRRITFSIPARQDTASLEMAIVSPKHGDPTLNSLGYRYADLHECRTYLGKHPPKFEKYKVNYFCCLGSRGDEPYGSFGGMLQYDEQTGEYKDRALNLHDHFGGVSLACNKQYVGVKDEKK